MMYAFVLANEFENTEKAYMVLKKRRVRIRNFMVRRHNFIAYQLSWVVNMTLSVTTNIFSV